MRLSPRRSGDRPDSAASGASGALVGGDPVLDDHPRHDPRAALGLEEAPKQHLLKAGWAMARPYRRRVVFAFLAVIGALITTLAGPFIVEQVINRGLVHHHSMRVVTIGGIIYVVVAVASFFFQRWTTGLLSGTGELVLNDLRKRVFKHLLSQPMSFFDSESSGQLLSRMTADIDTLESLIQNGIGTFVMSMGIFLTSVVVLILIAPLMFVATALCLVPVLIAAARYRTASTRAYRAVRLRIGEALASLDEGLAGVRVVQAFRQEKQIGQAFDKRNRAQLESELYTVRLSSVFFPKIEGTGVLATAVILLVGGALVSVQLTSVGAVAAYVLYVGNLFNSVQSLSQLFDLLQSSGAAFSTVVALLDTEPAMVDPDEPVALPKRGNLELRDVGFAYGKVQVDVDQGAANGGSAEVIAADTEDRMPAGGRPVLSDVDLEVRQGEHLVLVGPTGAGKSTLAKLIGRLYDPVAGVIRFGGVDLRRTSQSRLRRRIVVLPQEGFLFRGTVLDNILIGRAGAKEREARRAVEELGLAERLEALPNGLDTDVGERGSHLSAGERQLVSLARAALTDPAILVMDEATSSVDPGTERDVERALGVLTAGRTTITVAHRLTIAQRADRVALINDGRLLEVGPHEELVASGGAYARLFAAWQGQAEQLAD
ncbi:MAG TPA: ABC transporter ATP-binding protein [Acidimicrobiales bacterium]|nr:ABC transporter ATP-binding protein [Acidimicrobiales bacterium]